MSCIITYKGKKYSEKQFKEYFINNKNEFATFISKNKDVINSFKRKMEAIDGVFKDSPELAFIGSKAQYIQYLSIIFPDSQVKDIVYHGSPNKIEKFRDAMFGNYFSYSPIKGVYGSVIHSVLLNVKNPLVKPKPTDSTEVKTKYDKEYRNYNNPSSTNDASIEGSTVTEEGTQIRVKSPEQIHILGSKQDIDGFKEFVTQPSTSVNKGIEISSNTKGLGAALTNMTELAKRKGNIAQSYRVYYQWLNKEGEAEEQNFEDVEEAFQELKDKSEANTKPSIDKSKNYKLMVNLITAKLEQHPRLVSEITKQGGSAWILSSTHQPTTKNTVWETGGQNWFIKSLNDAYLSQLKPETNKPSKEVTVETNNVSEIEEPNEIDSTDMLMNMLSQKPDRTILINNEELTIKSNGKIYQDNIEVTDLLLINKVNIKKELEDGTLRKGIVNNKTYFVLTNNQVLNSDKDIIGTEISDKELKEMVIKKAVLYKKQC